MNFDMPPDPPNQERSEQEELPSVPEHECRFAAVRSSGPGGQNVNKTNTKIEVHWPVGPSPTYTEEQKTLIRAAATPKQLNSEDELYFYAQSARSQRQNKQEAYEHLNEFVARALAPKKERVDTDVPHREKQKRRDDKGRESQKKQDRKLPKGEW